MLATSTTNVMELLELAAFCLGLSGFNVAKDFRNSVISKSV